MDFSTLLFIAVVVLFLIGLYFYNRGRPAPHGTYDNKKYRSSGSIGGGKRSYDDPDYRSSGSIGGGPKAHNDEKFKSGGSIGR